MRRVLWLGVLWGGMLLLVACESDDSSPIQSATRGASSITTRTPQPTLDINEIPVLGEENPPPPVPLEVNDPRYPIQPADDDLVAEGKQLYDRFCASCHGVDGEGAQPDPYAPGVAPPHDDTGHTWHHADQQNFGTVWFGRDVNGLMPGYYDRMTPDEIITVLAYIKTWWSEDHLATQLDLSQRMVDGVSGASGE